MPDTKQCPQCNFTASYTGGFCPRCGFNFQSPSGTEAYGSHPPAASMPPQQPPVAAPPQPSWPDATQAQQSWPAPGPQQPVWPDATQAAQSWPQPQQQSWPQPQQQSWPPPQQQSWPPPNQPQQSWPPPPQQAWSQPNQPQPQWPQPGQPQQQAWPQQESAPAPAAGMCFQHPAVAAVQKCASCGAGICATCDFVIPAAGSTNNILGIGKERHLCPNCMSARRSGVPASAQPVASPALPLSSGALCSRHPEVPAVRYCGICNTTMCATCDFELPGYFHVCPGCATNPKKEMSSSRKRNLIISYVAAAWSTLGLVVLLSGALAGSVSSRSEEEALGIVIGILIFLPSMAGTGLAVSSLDKKLSNPPAIWGAVVWNGIILAFLIILTIIGNMM